MKCSKCGRIDVNDLPFDTDKLLYDAEQKIKKLEASASPAGYIQTEQKMRETLESIKAWDIEQSFDYDKNRGGLFILPEDLRKMIENALGN